MNSSPNQFYSERIQLHQVAISQLTQQLKVLGWARLSIFLAGISVTWGLWSFALLAAIGSGGACLAIFLFLVNYSQNLKAKKSFAQALVKVGEEEIKREKLELNDLDEGIEFLEADHAYARDLDIFGKHSIYQWLCRAGTGPGRKILADWLLKPSSYEQISERHPAVAELAQMPEWREAFQARGKTYGQEGDSPASLFEWVKTPAKLKKNLLLQIAALILLPLTLGAVITYFMGLIPGYYPLLGMAMNGILLASVRKITGEGFSASEGKAKLLHSYAEMVLQIEMGDFKAPWLVKNRKRLGSQDRKASDEIRELSKIFSKLELRLNGLGYFVMNVFFFWDIYWNIKLERWRERNSDHISDWFDLVGEFEASASLAGVSFLRPTWPLPNLTRAPLELTAISAGHPLLASEGRVNNPINIAGPGQVLLITGSNMSGKSTYLRTVGLNVVLALAGAPVCAESMQIGRISLISSMRTTDSLSEHISSFYAELKRLRQVLDLAEERDDVLFLLDEILKGTNSQDRHTGARRLIWQLHGMAASGLVSTHDLELSDLEQKLPQAVKNYSFNSRLENEDLVFEYTLTDGACKSFNASILMKQLGIGVDPPKSTSSLLHE